MGCNCGKEKKKTQESKRQTAIAAGTIRTVGSKVLKDRRDACKKCPYASRNPHPKYEKFGGLTNLSKCTLSNKPLLVVLKDPNFECPDKQFGKET
jgi:hypothetical protein